MGHDRVPVENGFGRGQSLFGVLHHKYTWCRERLDEIIDVLFCSNQLSYSFASSPRRRQGVLSPGPVDIAGKGGES